MPDASLTDAWKTGFALKPRKGKHLVGEIQPWKINLFPKEYTFFCS